MKKILITGSQGFIGTYICNEFLSKGYQVIGVDNFSKYGKLTRPHDTHKNFTLYEANILDDEFQRLVELLGRLGFVYFFSFPCALVRPSKKTKNQI